MEGRDESKPRKDANVVLYIAGLSAEWQTSHTISSPLSTSGFTKARKERYTQYRSHAPGARFPVSNHQVTDEFYFGKHCFIDLLPMSKGSQTHHATAGRGETMIEMMMTRVT